MSIAGGFVRAIDRAKDVDARALQLFVKSARRWAGKAICREEAFEFRERLDESGLRPFTLAHSSYLINLASPSRDLRERSILALRDELERCELLGVPYLVLHPGSHMGAGEGRGLERIARALDRLLAPVRSKSGPPALGVTVLLEVTAGQGTNLGNRFEHLARIFERTRSESRLGICFDTCHAFAAGYDMRDATSYTETFLALDRAVGLDRLLAFHLNDSSGGLGSRVDRHAHIGDGAMGVEPFRLLLDDRRFRDLPMVLETPKGPDLEEDRRNLSTLLSLIGSPS
jgi:deoxyribonuclease-4